MPFLLRFVTLEFVPELQFCNLLYCFPGAYLKKNVILGYIGSLYTWSFVNNPNEHLPSFIEICDCEETIIRHHYNFSYGWVLGEVLHVMVKLVPVIILQFDQFSKSNLCASGIV